MDQTKLRHICEQLPVFPLPNAVLLPGELLPLHVFEPRYRALVRHCIDGNGVFGMATITGNRLTENDGPPSIHRVIGVGEIVQHQPFPDGRSHLVLEYVGTGHLVEELDVDTPFRQVRCVLQSLDERGLDSAIQRLQILVIQLGALSPEAASEAQRMVALDAHSLVNGLARKLLTKPADRLAYLAAERMVDRVALVEDKLSRFLGGGNLPTAEA